MNEILFGKCNKTSRFISRTGILLALTVAVQYVFATFFKVQLLTGSVVNAFLILSASYLGIVGGGVIGLFTPLIGFLTGVVGNIVLTPFIGFANLVFVTVFVLVGSLIKKSKDTVWVELTAVILGALVKFFFMYLVCLKLLLPLVLPAIPEPIKVAFGSTQLFTAIIGGALAVILARLLKKSDALSQ